MLPRKAKRKEQANIASCSEFTMSEVRKEIFQVGTAMYLSDSQFSTLGAQHQVRASNIPSSFLAFLHTSAVLNLTKLIINFHPSLVAYTWMTPKHIMRIHGFS